MSETNRNKQAQLDIVENLLPAFEKMFLEKSSDYDGAFFFLGIKGQFSDINRKFWKLKAALWDDHDLTGEQADEILMDLIGHCFLTLHLLREEGLKQDAPMDNDPRPQPRPYREIPQQRCNNYGEHDPHSWAPPGGNQWPSRIAYCPGRRAS